MPTAPADALTKPQRAEAIASLKRYFEESLPPFAGEQPLGDLAAGLLLDYLLEELGPLVYNRAIAEAQARLQQRVLDLNGELFQDELQYWPRHDRKRRRAR